MTILYAREEENGGPEWSKAATDQVFRACAVGTYDPALVHSLANVTIVGTITGETQIGMGGGDMTGPIIQIESLFRWSDCLQGDKSAECYSGLLNPQAIGSESKP